MTPASKTITVHFSPDEMLEMKKELEGVRTKLGGRKFYESLPTLGTLLHLATDELAIEDE